MTHNGGQAHQVGDRGQQYEVTVYDYVHHRRVVVGWATELDRARGMRDGANLRPTWGEAKIKDRESGDEDVR